MNNNIDGLKKISSERTRSNILMLLEAKTIAYLCSIMPRWVTPNRLTAIGLLGSVLVFVSLYMAIENHYFLFLGVLGFAIQWFGDSLDGRLAYYRNIPRKWYGWSLDINMDWISTCIIGLGFYLYFPDLKIISFIFIIAYGGSMILALMRYKISDTYKIDSYFFGPTELRIIISVFLLLEIMVPGALKWFAVIGSIILITINVSQSIQIMRLGDQRDHYEKTKKQLAES